MKVEVLEDSGNELKFVVEGIYPALANALRRVFIGHVPTLAIEDVYIRENSSAMWDEVLAHRLGLLVIKTDLNKYRFKREGETEDTPGVAVKYYLKVKGPKIVYAKDLQPSDPDAYFVYPDTPIVILAEGQEIELEAVAYLGKGIWHAKWSPCLAAYQFWQEIEVKKEKVDKKTAEEIKKVVPQGVLEIRDGKIEIIDPNRVDGLEFLEEKFPDIFSVKRRKDKIIFYIESWGQLDKYEIVERGIDILAEEVRKFYNAIEEAVKAYKKE